MKRGLRAAAVLGAVATLAIPVSGCGGDGSSGDEAALGSVGEGVSPTGTGVGWIDLTGTREPRSRPGFLYGALVRGSVLPYVGAPAPTSDATGSEG